MPRELNDDELAGIAVQKQNETDRQAARAPYEAAARKQDAVAKASQILIVNASNGHIAGEITSVMVLSLADELLTWMEA